MEFRQLEVFVEVAERRSFSKAGDYLYLSQSTVSSHIKNLERELGKTLIQRTTKSLVLTAEGERFLKYARRIIDTRDAALESLEQASSSILHIGASSIPSAYYIPELISGFKEQTPGICFDIKQGDSDEIIEMIYDGTIDLGFVGKDCSSPKCECLPLLSDSIVLATPATESYAAFHRPGAGLSELVKIPLIMRELGSGSQSSAEELLNKLGIDPGKAEVVARTNDLESLKNMIVHGLGASIISRCAVEDLANRGKIFMYPLDYGVHRTYYIAYSKNRQLKPMLEKLVKYALAASEI